MNRSTPERPSRAQLAAALGAFALLGTVITWWMLGRPATGIDDTDIFLVYAKHFAGGQGFVYNIGGERVEGFTSLAWVLVASIPHALGLPVMVFLRAFSVLAVTVGWFALAHLVRKLDADALPAMLFLSFCVLVLSPNFVAWTVVSGMETGLWFAIIAMTIAVVASPQAWNQGRRGLGLCALVVALQFVRPEGLALCWLITALALADSYRRSHSLPASMRSILPLVATNLVTTALLTGFRWTYFGYPLPNTFYAKVSGHPLHNLNVGSDYLVRFFYNNAYWVVIFALALGALLWLTNAVRDGDRTPIFQRDTPENDRLFAVLAASLMLGAGLAKPLLTGADHFNQYRIFQPYIPLVCVSAALFVAAYKRASSTALRETPYLGIIATLTFAFVVFTTTTPGWDKKTPTGWEGSIDNEFYVAQLHRSRGDMLSAGFDFLEQLPSVGTVAAGGIKYTYAGRVYDLMGLNDTAMAHGSDHRPVFPGHSSFDPEVFLEQRPDLVNIWTLAKPDADIAPPGRNSFEAAILKDILWDARFIEHYRWTHLELYDQRGAFSFSLVGYVSKDFLKKMQAHPKRVRINPPVTR